MTEGFDWKGDMYADLNALKERLREFRPSALRIGDIDKTESALRLHAEMGNVRNPQLPLHKRVLSYLKSIVLLRRTRHRLALIEQDVEGLRWALANGLREDHDNLSAAIRTLSDQLRASISASTDRQNETLSLVEDVDRTFAGRIDKIGLRIDEVDLRIDEVGRRVLSERLARQRSLLELERHSPTPPDASAGNTSPLPASTSAFMAEFYAALEDRFRGSGDEVKQRLATAYRGDLGDACRRTQTSGPFIDIGCGRGEFLEIMAGEGLDAVGVDLSDTQLQSARDRGCDVVVSDAYEFLSKLESGSVTAVTGIHIVEHLPFAQLAMLLQQVARVLRPGGLALFETPNPRNLIVGATTFHFDPTHVKPLPPEVLALLLEIAGFAKVEIRPLHPSDTLEYMARNSNLDPHVASLLFGPQDYAALGILGSEPP